MSKIISSFDCVYCGFTPALESDHFVPISKQQEGEFNFEVPCCSPCNNIAGAKKFPTFEMKWAFVQRRRIELANRKPRRGHKPTPRPVLNLQRAKFLLEEVIKAIPTHTETDSSKTKARRRANPNRITIRQALNDFFVKERQAKQ